MPRPSPLSVGAEAPRAAEPIAPDRNIVGSQTVSVFVLQFVLQLDSLFLTTSGTAAAFTETSLQRPSTVIVLTYNKAVHNPYFYRSLTVDY